MKRFFTSLALLAVAVAHSAYGQFAVSGSDLNSSKVLTDFNALTGGSLGVSAGDLNQSTWAVVADSSAAALFTNSSTFGVSRAGGGLVSAAQTTGNVYAYDFGSGNKALLIQPSGSFGSSGTLTFRVSNSSSSVITGFTFGYSAYQRNDTNSTYAVSVLYSTTNVATEYTAISGLGFTTTSAQVASAPLTSVGALSGVVSGLSVAPGGSIYLRFGYGDASGSDNSGGRDEIAFDDLTFFATAIPEPSSFAVIAGGLALGCVASKRRRNS